jgi:predicted nucleotidyltransferase
MPLDVRYINVLKTLHSRLDEADIIWVIGGSLALVLEGLNITPRDIDLFTDKEGAYKIEELFAEFLVRNVSFSTKDNVRSHYGALNIDGIEVEIIGFIEFQNEDGTWYGGRKLEDVKRIFKLDNIEIPLMKLESQLRGYKRIGRKSRIRMIEEWMKFNTS